MIQNPVLKGFNPDPSICRVGSDYYIATSTFQWFPGVQIYHSTDLEHWRLIAHPLNRVSQLDMLGTPDSTGVWAPCLSYFDGLFYLIYSNLKNRYHTKDVTNYLVTAADVCGEWSEPIELNRSGFDPSLFHDDDGRKWFVNMKWGAQYGRNPFSGILLQEYSPKEKKLVGKLYNIFAGSPLKLTEAPHLYKHDGWYYLMVAEGGTGYDHAVTLARSKEITGPYEIHPQNPILTSKGTELQECLQKAGHASLVETDSGEWYLAHLCGRPIPDTNRCVLGRETALQKAEWRSDGWLWLCHDGNHPLTQVPSPTSCKPCDAEPCDMEDYFDEQTLNINWNTLRIPANPHILSLNVKKGRLRLYGRDSLESTFEQSLIARRQQSYAYTAETCMEFEPESSLHMAGLVCYYGVVNYYYLRMSFDETTQKYCLGVLASQNGDLTASMPQDDNILFDKHERVYLKAEVAPRYLQFHYRFDETGDWQKIGPVYDSSTLSDDYAFNTDFEFTGAYIGLCCQDSLYGGHPCDFRYFKYHEN